MRLQGKDFDRLARDVRQQPALLEAKSYLAQASESLRQSSNPIDTLVLLHALRGTGYARRSDQQEALDAVGCWLEQRIRRELVISSERLGLELGWLRRMTIAQRKEEEVARKAHTGEQRRVQDRANHDPRMRNRAQDRKSNGPAFGQDLNRLRSDRERALLAAQQQSEPTPRNRHSQIPAAPTELPEAFEVFFTDMQDVHKARRKLKDKTSGRGKKRSKAGEQVEPQKEAKPLKDRLCALRPVNASLARLAAGLVCSLLNTEGMDELFGATDANGGRPPAFYVRRGELAERDGKRVAQRVWLTLPELPPRSD